MGVALFLVLRAHLLASLLSITKHVLGSTTPPAGNTNMAQQLAHRLGDSLVKTVFVLWINASLAVTVSPSLWDSMLQLLTSLTHWPAVIDQWKVSCWIGLHQQNMIFNPFCYAAYLFACLSYGKNSLASMFVVGCSTS